MKFFFIVLLVFLLPFASSVESPFEVDKPAFYFVSDVGETPSFSLSIINGPRPQIISMGVHSSHHFLDIVPMEVSFSAYESRSFSFSFNSSSLSPGIYVGSLSFSGDDTDFRLPVVLEVQSPSPRFDAAIRELPFYSELAPGDIFSPQVVVYNLRSLDPSVTLSAFVYTLDGTIIAERTDSVSVPSSLELSLSLPLPLDMPAGPYIFGVALRTSDSFASSTTPLFVQSPLSLLRTRGSLLYYALGLIVVLLGAFLLINYLWHRHLLHSTYQWNKKLEAVHSTHQSEKTYRAALRQRALLKEAYEKQYISKATYTSTLRRLDQRIALLKKRL